MLLSQTIELRLLFDDFMDIIFEGDDFDTAKHCKNDKNTPDTPALRLVVSTEHSELVFNQSHELVVMASIIGMTYETLSRNSRAPIDLVAVIDRSGSMKERMALVISTLQFMIQQLKSHDSLGIVAYDSSVDVLLPLTQMDAAGKMHAKLAIEKMTTRGQTNLSGGLLQGLNMLRTHQGNDVCAVLLFTDGLANIGITKTEGIVKAVQGVLSQIDRVCSVFTFGYGTDPDPEYLKAISDQANGMYYYINNPNAIPDAFTDCLGGLLSVVAQNIRLTIEASKHTTIKMVDTVYRVLTEDPGKLYRVFIGDLYSEEQKDILCTIQTEALTHETAQEELITVEAEWYNVIHSRNEYQTATAVISRPMTLSVDTRQSFNDLIDKQKNRLIAAKALETAVSEGKKDKFNAAQQALQIAKQKILSSRTGADPYCQMLVRHLEQGSQEVKSRDTFEKGGYSMLTTTMNAHYQQRATLTTGSCYRTSYKTHMRDSYHIQSAPSRHIHHHIIAPSPSVLISSNHTIPLNQSNNNNNIININTNNNNNNNRTLNNAPAV